MRVLGVDDKAQAIRESTGDVREQIHVVASMNDSATKTVAESAEKKNRDVQSLDTALLPMVRELETLDNKLLVSIGLADAAEKNSLTSYPDRFDIASVTDLLDEIQDLKEVPFATESLQRSIDH